MEGLSVTIRLLDPPLHEFLPEERSAQEKLAAAMGISIDRLRGRIHALAEVNPMLGHRGCRLGITHPEITEMQTRAIVEAACALAQEGKSVLPEIMVPLVGNRAELAHQKAVIQRTTEAVFAEQGTRVGYLIGTMIEVPRAALTAAELAEEAEFFSFGTNDLTQFTLGYSRDDMSRFVPHYLSAGILTEDPFQRLDVSGVGELIRLGTTRGKGTRANLKVGLCGEHGGDPASIAFCVDVGLDYVSCSPYRVPVARLAAAQAALSKKSIAGKSGEA